MERSDQLITDLCTLRNADASVQQGGCGDAAQGIVGNCENLKNSGQTNVKRLKTPVTDSIARVFCASGNVCSIRWNPFRLLNPLYQSVLEMFSTEKVGLCS